MKDRHRRDNFHTDYDAQDDVYKILGILNTSWGDDWGGGFKHNDITYPMIPGDFIIFDPRIGHFAEDIKTDAKRLAIDFALRRK
jgi:ectoine hydroxylase-related dioxygenase (phytanoyl-CoA dioxygenase family)